MKRAGLLIDDDKNLFYKKESKISNKGVIQKEIELNTIDSSSKKVT